MYKFFKKKKISPVFKEFQEYEKRYRFTKSAEFIGNKYLDLFRRYIYYFIKFTFINNVYLKPHINNNKEKKILYLYREWGTNTTLIREISRSLPEFFGKDKIILIKLSKKENITSAVKKILANNNINYVIMDTRIMTTSNSYIDKIKSLYQCRYLSILFKKNRVNCICGLTDWWPSGYRLMAELITSSGGIVVVWTDTFIKVTPKFIHNRVIDNFFPPLSKKTRDEFSTFNYNKIKEYDIAIIGSNYEPRKSLVYQLIERLKENGISYYLNTDKKLDYLTYLSIYKRSKIGFNTNWINNDPEKFHCVGRNFEVMFAECLLLSQKCFGLDYYFTEGIDYVAYNDINDLIKKITFYLTNEKERKKIVKSGNNKVKNLYTKYYIWEKLNKSLEINHIQKIK